MPLSRRLSVQYAVAIRAQSLNQGLHDASLKLGSSLQPAVIPGVAYYVSRQTYVSVNAQLAVWQDRLPNSANAPFVNLEWPVPRAYPSLIDNRTLFENLIDYTLAGQDAVYGAPGEAPDYDWQLPTGMPQRLAFGAGLAARAPRESLVPETFYVGHDQFYGGDGDVPDYYWIVPKGYPYPLENRTALENLIDSTLLGADIIYGAPGQVVTYDLRPAKGYDYPEFRGYASDPVLQLVFLLIGQPPMYVLPNPTPAPARIVPYYILPMDLSILGKDQFYGGPGQAVTYEFQIALPPKGYKFPLSERLRESNDLRFYLFFAPSPKRLGVIFGEYDMALKPIIGTAQRGDYN